VLGELAALGLARQGCDIVVAARSTESSDRLSGSIYTVSEEVQALGGRVLAVPIDVRDSDQIDDLAVLTIERFGRIDILINNAGALRWKPLLDTPAKRFDLVMGVNARAAFLASRAMLPHMIARRWGISSICRRRSI
jgi:citronellol/citronellal dehydrogenase